MLLLSLFACAGPAGAPGATGPTGPTGPAGAAGTGLHWVDAAGDVVVPWAEAVWIDDAGDQWSFDFEGNVWPQEIPAVYYPAHGCNEDAYILTVPPRVVVEDPGWVDGGMYVRPDDLAETCATLQSYSTAVGDCNEVTTGCGGGGFLAIADLQAVDAVPEIPNPPPFHLEP